MMNSNVRCGVNDCIYNTSKSCTLDSIEIGVTNNNPTNSIDTQCSSFER